MWLSGIFFLCHVQLCYRFTDSWEKSRLEFVLVSHTAHARCPHCVKQRVRAHGSTAGRYRALQCCSMRGTNRKRVFNQFSAFVNPSRNAFQSRNLLLLQGVMFGETLSQLQQFETLAQNSPKKDCGLILVSLLLYPCLYLCTCKDPPAFCDLLVTPGTLWCQILPRLSWDITRPVNSPSVCEKSCLLWHNIYLESASDFFWEKLSCTELFSILSLLSDADPLVLQYKCVINVSAAIILYIL